MSGSSYGSRTLSRCVVGLDSGLSISWASGSESAGMEHHRKEENQFLRQIDAAAARIEVIFDELETKGRRFHAPGEAEFNRKAQHQKVTKRAICHVMVWCEPALSPSELTALTTRIAELTDA